MYPGLKLLGLYEPYTHVPRAKAPGLVRALHLRRIDFPVRTCKHHDGRRYSRLPKESAPPQGTGAMYPSPPQALPAELLWLDVCLRGGGIRCARTVRVNRVPTPGQEFVPLRNDTPMLPRNAPLVAARCRGRVHLKIVGLRGRRLRLRSHGRPWALRCQGERGGALRRRATPDRSRR